jgi:hypothetical protein
VCSFDPYCCLVAWDSTCVGEVQTFCGQSCTGGGGTGGGGTGGGGTGGGGTGGGGTGGGGTCAHPICSAGQKLSPSCDPCAQKICSLDGFCCGVKWDSICVAEVGGICGLACN